MRNLFYVVLFGIACTTMLTSCNMVAGLGKDVKKGGSSLEQTAREEQQRPAVKRKCPCPPSTTVTQKRYFPTNRSYNPSRTDYID